MPSVWRFFTFSQNFGLDIKHFGTFSHAWSLCVEEHFYLFLPLILIVLVRSNFLRKGYLILLILFLSGFLIRLYNWNNLYEPFIDKENSWMYWYKYLYYPTYNRLDGLLIGVSIAGLYQFFPKVWDRISHFGNLFIGLSLLVLARAYFLCYEEHSFYASIFGFPLIAIGYGLIVIGAISPTSFLFKWRSSVTTFIATLSYGIYLTHKGVIHLTQEIISKQGIDINSNLMLIISVMFCVLAAISLNFLIEKPFMKLRAKILAN
jgi:peptidoglycan/LPS O-acetylase OafA/YrhL